MAMHYGYQIAKIDLCNANKLTITISKKNLIITSQWKYDYDANKTHQLILTHKI